MVAHHGHRFPFCCPSARLPHHDAPGERRLVGPLVPGRQQRSRRCAASPSGRVVQALAEERCCTCRTVLPARSPGQTVSSWRAPTRVGSAVVMAVARTGAGRSRGALSRSPTGSSWTSPMMSPLSDDTLRHRKTWFPISLLNAWQHRRTIPDAAPPTSWRPQGQVRSSRWCIPGPRRPTSVKLLPVCRRCRLRRPPTSGGP